MIAVGRRRQETPQPHTCEYNKTPRHDAEPMPTRIHKRYNRSDPEKDRGHRKGNTDGLKSYTRVPRGQAGYGGAVGGGPGGVAD